MTLTDFLRFFTCRVKSTVFASLFFAAPIAGQDFSGFHTGGWAGVNALFINPANVVDSRFKVDINLLSVHSELTNNFMYVASPLRTDFGQGDFSDFVRLDTFGVSKSMHLNYRLQLPSFMFAIDRNNAIGISVTSRGLANMDRLSNDIATLVYRATLGEEIDYRALQGDFMAVNSLNWHEIGFSYGRVLLDEGQHFLKAGVTAKILLGTGATYASVDDFRFRYDNDTVQQLSGRVSYGYTDNYGSPDFSPADLFSPAGFGLGMDIGAVYEWRPDRERNTYTMDGKSNLWYRHRETYKLRAGLSLRDLGYIRYTRAGGSRDYTADVSGLPISFFEGIEDPVEFFERLEQAPGVTMISTGNQPFSVGIPFSLAATVDWQIIDGLFLNVTPIISFNQGIFVNRGVGSLSSITFVPRYEIPWFGAYMPVSLNQLSQFNWGLSLRLGPVFLGSGSLFSNLMRSEWTGTDFHLGFKVPIPHTRPKDRDFDQVSDKRDRCPDQAGLWEFEGCPDTDKDGIPDHSDECPFEAGLPQFRGCPDTDGDGIPDKDDECPYEPGLALFKGCPDTDGDGVPDKDDRCPEVAGPEEFRGCPDSDGDGIPDIDDECPLEPGLPQFKGCPDRDGDGIPDKDDLCPDLPGPAFSRGCPDSDGDGVYDDKDKCPDVPGLPELDGCPYADTDGDGVRDIDDKCPDIPGPVENDGCPYTDTDGDGVIDLEDKCPNTPGPKENFGCPVVEKEVVEVLKMAFDNLEFASGKATILPGSFDGLNRLVEQLKKRPDFLLLIEGHTDNVGSRTANVNLSRNRANAVKAYLVKAGISAERITAKWYGPDKPIATNDTEEGRQRNRRVEMTIGFK